MDNTLVGTINALLDEYKKAIDELCAIIRPLSTDRIVALADDQTTNPNCRSIQTILTHVIYAGYAYTIFMQNHVGNNIERPAKEYFQSAKEYIEGLQKMFNYCKTFFIQNPMVQIEETDNAKKILTNWDQTYDIEHLMEHAIVHILKHRRQVERFLKIPS